MRSKKPSPYVSVIIPVKNESHAIARVVHEAKKIYWNSEVIVVCNGTTDRTPDLAKKAGARVIQVGRSLGYDVGRAVGAFYATGDILLFIDGDFVVNASHLKKFCLAIHQGYDLALNAYSGRQTERTIHPTAEAKKLLNKWLGCPQLRGSSLTTVPHALSRQAIEVIGYEDLMIPPKALAKAVVHHLKIKRAHGVNVFELNKKRPERKRDQGIDIVENLIIGDHAEAAAYLMTERGERADFPDAVRDRRRIREDIPIQTTKGYPRLRHGEKSVSVILPVCNEQETMDQLLSNVKALQPKEIIAVENGSTDATLTICRKHGVTCVSYPDPLGYDVGRAIGAKVATGDVLLFLDGDIVWEADDLLPFIQACHGELDVALNNVNPFYTNAQMVDYVSMAKAFVNRLINRRDLGYSSMTAVPHAIKKSALEKIGVENLAVPPKAQVIAQLKGLAVDHVRGVNVLQLNKRKPDNTPVNNDVEKLILGDHLEALNWAQAVLGERVYLEDAIRVRDLKGRVHANATV